MLQVRHVQHWRGGVLPAGAANAILGHIPWSYFQKDACRQGQLRQVWRHEFRLQDVHPPDVGQAAGGAADGRRGLAHVHRGLGTEVAVAAGGATAHGRPCADNGLFGLARQRLCGGRRMRQHELIAHAVRGEPSCCARPQAGANVSSGYHQADSIIPEVCANDPILAESLLVFFPGVGLRAGEIFGVDGSHFLPACHYQQRGQWVHIGPVGCDATFAKRPGS
mmetsp:Transcript_78321/g.226457  ORF Transcript_78321/g.226457 Transcript_78321/m.226457 type:complete len:222 (-) Transcript_78321:225-890(-)